jgi:hypothetical protein
VLSAIGAKVYISLERFLREGGVSPRDRNRNFDCLFHALVRPNAAEELEKLVDFQLRAKVVPGVGPLPPADADGDDIAEQGEGVLVCDVVTDIQSPTASQSIPLGG